MGGIRWVPTFVLKDVKNTSIVQEAVIFADHCVFDVEKLLLTLPPQVLPALACGQATCGFLPGRGQGSTELFVYVVRGKCEENR